MNPSHCVVFLLFVAAASSSSFCEAAITTCDQVIGDLLGPCFGYLTGVTGAKPPPVCCDGAKAMVALAATKEDRRIECECVKGAAQAINMNFQNAHDLPNYCNIHLPFDINPDVDCSKIN